MKLASKEKCCGCSACKSICPKHAIQMVQNEEGFYSPQVDSELCVECGACTSKCPAISTSWKKDKGYQAAYACANKNENVRERSSSGGVFYELAKKVVENNGHVYGCAWIAPGVAAHIMVDCVQNITGLMKSKYVQSDVGDTYRNVKRDLESGTMVLFSGTPCQNAGLRNYLGKTYPNLLCVEFICHGVPSKKLLKRYISEYENEHECIISGVDFRTKVNGWKTLTLEIQTKHGDVIYEKASENSYYKAFLLNLSVSPACSSCQYNSLPRIADITLGDFWGISNTEPVFQDDTGVSCVVINSPIGKEFFDTISDRFVCEEVTFDMIKKENPFINGHCRKHRNAGHLWEAIEQQGIEKAVKSLLKPSPIEWVIEVSTYKLNRLKQRFVNLFIKIYEWGVKAGRRRKLKSHDFTIISNNCWGSFIYQKYGLKYLSPTAGVYILGHDFVKLCSKWEWYFAQELEFIPFEESSYYYALNKSKRYPVARLGDIEVYFMHYLTEQEAAEKWARRVKRINPEKMIFKLSQREECSKEDIIRFMDLPIKNKVCFAYDSVPGVIQVPELKGFLGDEQPIVEKYFNEVELINSL